MYTVYALYSPSFDKSYIGQTEDLKRRFFQHSDGLLSIYTKKCKPWEVIHTEEYTTRSEAMKREKQLKSSRGRTFIWDLVRKSKAT